MRQKEKIKPAAASRILVPADVAAAAGCCHPSCRLPRTGSAGLRGAAGSGRRPSPNPRHPFVHASCPKLNKKTKVDSIIEPRENLRSPTDTKTAAAGH